LPFQFLESDGDDAETECRNSRTPRNFLVYGKGEKQAIGVRHMPQWLVTKLGLRLCSRAEVRVAGPEAGGAAKMRGFGAEVE